MNFSIGEIAMAKVGRNLIRVEVLECCDNCFKLRSLSSGREFETCRLEKINNINQEETIMSEQIINMEIDDDRPNPAPECAPHREEKKRSLFDVAIEILKQSDHPMNTKEIVKKAIESGLWNPSGAKTPEQTLYSAIHRENATKEHPRIIKSEQKGKFQYNG